MTATVAVARLRLFRARHYRMPYLILVQMQGSPFVFCSSVPKKMQPLVEELFFFNKRQSEWHDGIVAAVKMAGSPAIREREGRIWIGVPSGAMQCLFACTPKEVPLAVMLYGRPSADTLWISHMCVDPRFTATENRISGGLGLLLFLKAQEIALSIKGVSRIQLPYSNHRFFRLRN